jgi:SAM-dependent methyltransferase
MGWSDDARLNHDLWTTANAEYTDGQALRKWQEDCGWRIWDAPESEVGALGDVTGLDVVELGCGTAYLSAWLARSGARPIGVDVTPAQLATARRCMSVTGIEFPLLEADAGATGLPDACADLVVSEYGASTWVDPGRRVPEAARLLRAHGRLVFLCGSPLVTLCAGEDGNVDERLHRPQFGTHRLEWPGEGVSFQLPHGEWIALLRASGFEVERLVELQAPPASATHPYYHFVSADWARRWPAEEIWAARKRL